MLEATKVEAWRTHLRYDREGRGYLTLEGAALYLEMSTKGLSNRLYIDKGPRVQKKNGRLRFYMDDLRIFEKGMQAIAHETNWHKMRKAG